MNNVDSLIVATSIRISELSARDLNFRIPKVSSTLFLNQVCFILIVIGNILGIAVVSTQH